ncbi:UNVERIFIED_CONTAM: hypothetical protein HDU68_004298, partial [Siphonaria sp. JEL0065]
MSNQDLEAPHNNTVGSNAKRTHRSRITKAWIVAVAILATIAATAYLVYHFRFEKPTSSTSAATFLGLENNWQLQVPVLDPTTHAVRVVSNPDLQSLSNSFFYLNQNQTAVVFYTNNTGVTTPGSNSPRTELRQTAGNGTKLAWSSNDSVAHVLNVTLQVDHVPAE